MDVHWIDLVVIVVYLLGITGIGIWFSRNQRDSSSGYFLASRSLKWVTVGLALFATNISTVHLTGLAGAGFKDGMVFGNFEWMAPFMLILLGIVFAPFYFRSRVRTLPEYLEGRFGPNSRTVLAFMAVVGALFIHIGVTIYAGAEVMKGIIPIDSPEWWIPMAPYVDFNIAISISIVSFLTIVYTTMGGLKAVVVTESIQTVLLLLGAAAITIFGVVRLYSEQGTTSLTELHRDCVVLQAQDDHKAAESLKLTADTFRSISQHQADGHLDKAGAALATLADKLNASHTTKVTLGTLDQPGVSSQAGEVLQLCLAKEGAESLDLKGVDFAVHVEALEKAAGIQLTSATALDTNARSAKPYSKKLSMIHTEGDYTWWIMLLGYPIIGIWYWCADQTIVQRVLGARTELDAQIGPIFAGFIKVLPVFLMVFPGVIAYVLFRDKIGENADSTLSVLILELLPCGMRGLVLAGLLAAMMSTVAGALNSAATLVSIDIVQRLRPKTADRTLVRIGQITTVLVMLAAVAWSTQGARFGGIFEGISRMIAVLSPPITAVFIWGIFWHRGTAIASLTTLISGFVLGIVSFVLDFPAFGIRMISREWGIPFLLQAFILFCICSFIFIVVSLLTPRPRPEQVEKYCWKSPLAVLTEKRISGVSDPRILALLLVAVMAVCYWIFA